MAPFLFVVASDGHPWSGLNLPRLFPVSRLYRVPWTEGESSHEGPGAGDLWGRLGVAAMWCGGRLGSRRLVLYVGLKGEVFEHST